MRSLLILQINIQEQQRCGCVADGTAALPDGRCATAAIAVDGRGGPRTADRVREYSYVVAGAFVRARSRDGDTLSVGCGPFAHRAAVDGGELFTCRNWRRIGDRK